MQWCQSKWKGWNDCRVWRAEDILSMKMQMRYSKTRTSNRTLTATSFNYRKKYLNKGKQKMKTFDCYGRIGRENQHHKKNRSFKEKVAKICKCCWTWTIINEILIGIAGTMESLFVFYSFKHTCTSLQIQKLTVKWLVTFRILDDIST